LTIAEKDVCQWNAGRCFDHCHLISAALTISQTVRRGAESGLMDLDSAPMDIDKADSPAASAGEQGGGQGADHGCGSSRELLQQIQSVASQIASDAERADHIIALQSDNATQPDSLAAVRNTLSDTDSALTKGLARIGGKGFRWHSNVNDSRPGGAVVGTATKPQKSTAVSAGDEGESKRRPVDVEPAAAAAAAGGSVDVCGPAERTKKPMKKPKKYGRPCLSGLPEDVFSNMGSFVTTKTAARLAKVNKDIHTMATDETFGVFRHFTMTCDEGESYSKIRDVNKDTKHLGKTQVAHVPWIPPVVPKLLGANKDSIRKITLDFMYGSRTSDAEPIVFSSVTDLDVRWAGGLKLIRYAQRGVSVDAIA